MIRSGALPTVTVLTYCCLVSAGPALERAARPNQLGPYPPRFVSVSGGHTVKKGGTVVLPCAIQDLSDMSVIWWRQKLALSLRNLVLRDQSRLSLLDGYNLQIRQARPSDAGVYTCAVALSDRDLEQTQTLDVQYGPFIRTVPEAGQLIVQEGNNATLECSARGNPKPRVRWRKKDVGGASGVELAPGERLALLRVARADAGLYECVAENSIGDSVAQIVSLQVLYRPEVAPKSRRVHTGEGFKVQLACFVLSDPLAEVTWSRRNSPIDHRRASSSSELPGARHVLTIDSVQPEDLDTYTCTARNELGTAHAEVVVTGEADKVEITSAPMGGDVDSYDLAWKVKSFSPVLEYKIAYRKTKVNSTGESPGRWKEVLVPTTGRQPVADIHFEQRVTLRHLTPATAYDLRIQAQNKHGWNRVSDTFHFSTIGRAMESRSWSGSRGGRLTLYVHIYFITAGVILASIV
ncbi:protein amalgam-like [Amphibalanus amphitrite]|uniref:protein amalgam-like n=1 Tax=Amphibalanus amphitrite TaxID=1232801 RepID=UPI001C9173B5|nr:protein amalgam-like [Amphibalanus amphitrite]